MLATNEYARDGGEAVVLSPRLPTDSGEEKSFEKIIPGPRTSV